MDPERESLLGYSISEILAHFEAKPKVEAKNIHGRTGCRIAEYLLLRNGQNLY